CVCLALSSPTFAQKRPVPTATLLVITRAEDERRWDDDLRKLLSNPNAAIRQRAALAVGRIGDERSVSALTDLLQKDVDPAVRAMAAFALGEVESDAASEALIAVVKNASSAAEIRARALEALGKIAAALPREKESRQRELGAAILDALKSEKLRPKPDQSAILFGLTAALRSRPANAGRTIAEFLDNPNPRVRADAANAL